MRPDEALAHLRRAWLRLAITWLVVWLIGYQLLRDAWPYAEQWLLLSGVTLAYSLWIAWRYLPENHRAGETAVLPTLGTGNRLTLLRGLLIGLLAGFLFQPWPQGALAWVVVLLYTTADIADYFDGYLARRANHATLLGGRLDMEFDGLGLMVVSLLAVWWGQLPWWYLSVGVARYLFVFGLWWRERRGLPVHDIPSSVHRRVVAGIQMGLMSVVLWPIVPAAGARLAGSILAFATLLSFLRDWLIASGVIDPAAAGYNRVRGLLWRLTTQWLPPIWRVVLVISMAIIYQSLDSAARPQAWVALLESWGVPGAPALATLLSLTALAGTLLVALGVFGRTAAIALLFPLGFDCATRGLTWENGLALTAVMWVLVLGSGRFALWPADDRFYLQRGAAQAAGDGGFVLETEAR